MRRAVPGELGSALADRFLAALEGAGRGSPLRVLEGRSPTGELVGLGGYIVSGTIARVLPWTPVVDPRSRVVPVLLREAVARLLADIRPDLDSGAVRRVMFAVRVSPLSRKVAETLCAAYRAAGFSEPARRILMVRRVDGVPGEEAPEGVRLVPGEPEHLDELVTLYERAYADSQDTLMHGLDREDYRHWLLDTLAGERGHYVPEWSWRAYEGEAPYPSGFVICTRLEDGGAMVAGLGVLPEARRRGIARALLGQVLRTAYEAGIRELRLAVGEENEPALRLYRKLGFGEIGASLVLQYRLPVPGV